MFKIEINKESINSNTCVPEMETETWNIYYTMEYGHEEILEVGQEINFEPLSEGLVMTHLEYIDDGLMLIFIKNVVPVAINYEAEKRHKIAKNVVVLSEEEYWTLYERYHKDSDYAKAVKKGLFEEQKLEKKRSKEIKLPPMYKPYLPDFDKFPYRDGYESDGAMHKKKRF